MAGQDTAAAFSVMRSEQTTGVDVDSHAALLEVPPRLPCSVGSVFPLSSVLDPTQDR